MAVAKKRIFVTTVVAALAAAAVVLTPLIAPSSALAVDHAVYGGQLDSAIGLSTGVKVAIGLSVAAVVGVVVWLLWRRRRSSY